MSVIYARIAKYSVIIIALLCALSFTLLMMTEAGSVHTLAARVFVFAVFPGYALAQFCFADHVKSTLIDYGFQVDGEVRTAIRQLLAGLEVRVRVGIYHSEEINAFAISSISGKDATIAFSTALIRDASFEEFYATAAHEVAHVINGDSRAKLFILAFHQTLEFFPNVLAMFGRSVLSGFAWMIPLVVAFAVALAYVSGADIGTAHLEDILWLFVKIGWPAPAAVVGAWLLRHILHHAFLAYSREREYAADATAAALTSPEMVLLALNFLPDDEREGNGFFDSHPPLKERKRRIVELQINSKNKKLAVTDVVGTGT